MAVLVICVGMLGIAKLQALSLSNANTSRLRSLAAIEAASLAAAMHSNRQYWAATAPTNVTIPPPPGAIASSDAALAATANADLGAPPPTQCFGGAGGAAQCAALNLAAFDLARWTVSVNALLPNPTTTIACPPVAGVAAPTSCTIQIAWTERAVAVNAQEANAAANAQFQTPTYLLYVEP